MKRETPCMETTGRPGTKLAFSSFICSRLGTENDQKNVIYLCL